MALNLAAQGAVPTDGLTVRGLSVALGRGAGPAVQLVHEASLAVARGEVVALVGESGSGKSTLVRAVAGLLPRTAPWRVRGELSLGATDLLGLDEAGRRQVRGRRIGFVFQEPQQALNPTWTVRRQITQALPHIPKPQRRAHAEQLLTRLGFPEPEVRAGAYPHELSGGLRQRVLVALALAQGPELVIADEPTAHLDARLKLQVLSVLRAEVTAAKAGLLIVSHDLSMVSEVADRVYVMYAGTIVEHGTTAEVLRQPRHRYTAALIEALPAQDGLPKAIPGQVPGLMSPPPGCAFHPRCAFAVPECGRQRPEFTRQEERGWACWRPRGAAVTP